MPIWDDEFELDLDCRVVAGIGTRSSVDPGTSGPLALGTSSPRLFGHGDACSLALLFTDDGEGIRNAFDCQRLACRCFS